jgi:hypothetical protein
VEQRQGNPHSLFHTLGNGSGRELTPPTLDVTNHLHLVPKSVDTFEYRIDYQRELSYNPAQDATSYLNPRGMDEFSFAFRSLSTRLRKLELEYVRVSSSLFWPGAGEEKYDTASLNWPRLEELLILEVPPYTADGMLCLPPFLAPFILHTLYQG